MKLTWLERLKLDIASYSGVVGDANYDPYYRTMAHNESLKTAVEMLDKAIEVIEFYGDYDTYEAEMEEMGGEMGYCAIADPDIERDEGEKARDFLKHYKAPNNG